MRSSDEWSGRRGHGVYGPAGVGRGVASLQFTIWLHQYFCLIVLIDPHLCLHKSSTSQRQCDGALFSPPHCASLAWKNNFFSFYIFPLNSWQEGIRLWFFFFLNPKKPTQPVATLVFLPFSSCTPWLRLSLYRLPSQDSNLPGLAGTWLKIRKQCMVAQAGAEVSCWWTRPETHTQTPTRW